MNPIIVKNCIQEGSQIEESIGSQMEERVENNLQELRQSDNLNVGLYYFHVYLTLYLSS